jgi:dolichol-phosphate mannosyltransferase
MLSAVKGADVVIGSRYVPGGGTENWGVHRVALSRFANLYATTILQIPAHDVTSGYRLYRAEALTRIDRGAITSNGYSFLGEVLYRLHVAGAALREVPILFVERTKGRSKLASREIYVGAFRILALRFHLPHSR